VDAADFVARMKDMLHRRDADTRESLSTWQETNTFSINSTIVDKDYEMAKDNDENLLADELEANKSDDE
jgi:hypothetical protein